MSPTPTVVLLHGWPGTKEDYRLVAPRLASGRTVLVPDLLGYGAAFHGELAASEATAEAHARRLLADLADAGRARVVLVGYDIGSRVAQAAARLAPERVAGLVVTPAFPALASRLAQPDAQARAWYQHLHRLPLADALVDGHPAAVRSYLEHFWSTWSATDGLATGPDFDALVAAYARPGAFTASIAWYRANLRYEADPIHARTILLWGESDPLFPAAWAGDATASFTDLELRVIPGCGHFLPLEAPGAVAAAIAAFDD